MSMELLEGRWVNGPYLDGGFCEDFVLLQNPITVCFVGDFEKGYALDGCHFSFSFSFSLFFCLSVCFIVGCSKVCYRLDVL